MSEAWRQIEKIKDQSWSTLLKTALVRLPRAVPIQALHITNPSGPFPFKLNLQSRERKRTIPVYIFVPPVSFPSPESQDAVPTPNAFPVIMDYHGGGFYLGSCLEQAPFCSKLCRELNAIVIGVDYRMAPLDKFPAALEDAEDVVSAVLDAKAASYHELREGIADFLRGKWHDTLGTEKERKKNEIPLPPQPKITLDTTRIAFSGASSGGNIALNMAMNMPASHGLPEWPCKIPSDFATQIPLLLLYPALDLRLLPWQRNRNEHMPPAEDPKSIRLDIDNHLAATYVSREMAGHPRASPGLVHTRTCLHPQAKALLILSGLDTLWEQSEIWCKKLEDEGRSKDVKTMRYADRKHGWTQIPEIALSTEERKTRLEVLDECVKFTDLAWRGRNPVAVMDREDGVDVKAQGSEEMKVHDRRDP